jgi:hypothetical protein
LTFSAPAFDTRLLNNRTNFWVWLSNGDAWRRLWGSAVAWSFAFNGLRLASGVLLLPLLLRMLTKADLGMYYVFLSLSGIIVILDLGFSPTVGRFVNYAMGGAKKITPMGLADEMGSVPNYTLLWELVLIARAFYRLLSLTICVLLATGGTALVSRHIHETSSVPLTWAAWIVAVAAIMLEIYCGAWNVMLRNLNQVLVAARIAAFAYLLRLLLACALLLSGAGLLSLPIASLVTSVLIGDLSRRRCLAFLRDHERPKQVDWRGHFRTIWPNCWRLGLYFAGFYISANVNVMVCSSVFGLAANARYGLSLQVLNIVTGMSMVWVTVKWPQVGQLVARKDRLGLRQLLWPRFWLVMASFVVLAGLAFSIGPGLIQLLRTDKEMLAPCWLALLALGGLLENHCSFWNTLVSMWNELPMVWASLAANLASLALNLLLVHAPGANPGVLVIGPLLAGLVYNYWRWPQYGAGTVGLSWFEFIRRRPAPG